MEETRLAVIRVGSYKMEYIFSVDIYSANKWSQHFHISKITSENTSTAIDSFPFCAIQTVSIEQFLACWQGIGEQICFSACGVEFGCRSSSRHGLDLQLGVWNIVSYFQSAVDKLTACSLLAMDGDYIVRTV